MKRSIVGLILLFVSTNISAQMHKLQIDNGGANSIIQGSNPGGTYTLPTGGGSILTTGGGTASGAWLQGGNTNAAIANYGTIGTLDAADMSFFTNGLANTRMTILSTGNIGIGTPTPASLLSVGNTNQFQIDASGHLITTTTVLPIGFGANDAFLYLATGSDVAGNVTFDLAPIVGSGSVTITFSTPYATAPTVVLTPASSQAADATSIFGVYVTSTANDFTINFSDTPFSPPVFGQLIKFNYMVVH
jgi:hypothetical protein